MDALRALRKETRKLSNEEAVCQICDSLADVAVTETVPNAQDWVDRIKEETESVKTQVEAVRGYLDDILRELDSVLHIEVLRNNDTDSELDI
jgi:hypothetical protein